MPWRTRTVLPLSDRFHERDPDRRPPMQFVARRLPHGARYVEHSIWHAAPLSPEAREHFAPLALVCTPWEARLTDEAQVSALVLVFSPWPRDLVVKLSDAPNYGLASRHYPIVVLTPFSATAVWGGSERTGFQQLVDDIYDHRDARSAPDLDALGTLAP